MMIICILKQERSFNHSIVLNAKYKKRSSKKNKNSNSKTFKIQFYLNKYSKIYLKNLIHLTNYYTYHQNPKFSSKMKIILISNHIFQKQTRKIIITIILVLFSKFIIQIKIIIKLIQFPIINRLNL